MESPTHPVHRVRKCVFVINTTVSIELDLVSCYRITILKVVQKNNTVYEL